MKTLKRTNIRQSSIHIRYREPFQCGGNAYGMANMRGEVFEKGFSVWGTGSLAGPAKARWELHKSVGHIEYVVFSYHTPIAWFSKENGWYVVEDKFSSSTTRHQTAVRMAML